MFSEIVSFFTGVEVKEENSKTIRVTGMKTPEFISAVSNLWKTSKITTNMFRKIKSRQLDIHPFFAPDFYYVCKRLLGERRVRINRNAVSQIQQQLETNTWMKSAFEETFVSRLNFKAIDRLSVDLLVHQTQFLHRYNEMVARWFLKGYILGAAAGSGKTIICIALSECLDTDITICIVPKNSVDRVWSDTLEWIFKVKQPYWKSTSGEPLKQGYRYYVAHYEQLERILEFFKYNSHGKKINIVLDESHNFNDLKSQRTDLFLQLCKITNCQDTVYSSGTPIKAMGSEVIPILRAIDPFFDEEAEARFRNIYGLSSARGLDILAHRLGYMTFKVDKAVVVGNTVEKFRVDVTLKNGEDYTLNVISNEMRQFIKERQAYYKSNMSKYIEYYMQGIRFYEHNCIRTKQEADEFHEYVRTARLLHLSYDPYVHKQEPIFCNQFEKKYIIPALPKGMKEQFKDARSVYKYVNLKVQGEALGRILGKKRTQCNVDMLSAWDRYQVTDLQTGEKFETTLVDIIDNSIKKTVIFTSYVEVVDKACEIFKEAGGFPLKVYGETNNDLPQIISTFDRDTRCNPLVATLQSLSTAVPLVMANTAVFLNAPFRDHEKEQACSRVDRLGQTEVVQIFDVFLDTGKEPNISTRSLDIMEWSRSMVEAMMGTAGASSVAIECLDDVGEELKAAMPISGVTQTESVTSLNPGCESRYSW
jgi:SNF2 family DNA or RNA helicase